MGDRATALAFYNQAVESVNDKANPQHLQHSFQLFVSACYADPTYWQAHYQAGNNNSDMNFLPAAIACFRRALECEATLQEHAKVLTNLGWRLHNLGRNDEALEHTLQAIKQDPMLAYAWVNLSLIHGHRGDTSKGLKAAEHAFKLAPQDPIVEMSLAFALLFAGRYAEGLKHFEIRFPYKLKNFLQYPYPKWQGEPDKTIFLVADQGLGDTLCFSRFVEKAAARAKFIHAMVQPECMRLFSHAFAHLTNVNLLPSPCHFPQADAWSTFVSLPFALRLSDEEIRSQGPIDIPAYEAPPNVHWKVSDRDLHIGIAWAGSPLNEIDKYRNIPVANFLDLYEVPGIQLYGLQVGERNKDMHESGCAPVIRDITPYIRDVVDTVALLRELDLVICCESALGHIAGMAGVECWIPYSYSGKDYRLGMHGERILWYENHRVFLQDQRRTWEPVFTEITKVLRKKIRLMTQRKSQVSGWSRDDVLSQARPDHQVG